MTLDLPPPALVPASLREVLTELRCFVVDPRGRLLWLSPAWKRHNGVLRGFLYLEMVFTSDLEALSGWFADGLESSHSFRAFVPGRGSSHVIHGQKIRLGDNWLVVGAVGDMAEPEVPAPDFGA